jgi:hypothetical protein
VSCAPCAQKKRAVEHRAQVQAPVARQPFPWPADVASGLAVGIRQLRKGIAAAEQFVATQPIGPRKLVSHQQLARWKEQLRLMEQSVIRTGVA